MTGKRYWMGLMGVVSGTLLSQAVTPPRLLAQGLPDSVTPVSALSLSQLADGAYQFCTEPDPQDWQDGAGACLNVVKQGANLNGYYGYPHSDVFVCLQGELAGNLLNGRGLMTAWVEDLEATETNTSSSDAELAEEPWDIEGRLFLGQPEILQTEDAAGDDQIDWILYQQASLNVDGLYAYPSPRMTPVDQLCSWPG